MIRISRLTYLGIVLVFAAAMAPAMAAPRLFAWLPLVPLLGAVWIARCRTTVTADALLTRSLRENRRIEWTAVRGIRFPKYGWARADLTDDTEATLPAVSFDRLRDLADASGGRIPNPYRIAARGKDGDPPASTADDPESE